MPPATSAPARPRILCVDDEPNVLEGLRDALRRSFDVRVATSGAEGLRMLGADPDAYTVVVSDMRMPAMPGSVFLTKARRVAPNAVRILLTGHADVDAAIDAVNDGQLFRFLTKPCPGDELLRACAAALGQHRMVTAERVLLQQTLRGSVKALTDALALACPAALGRGARIQQGVGRLARELGLDVGWEVEIAAMLVHLGAVTLPDATAERLYAGATLDDDERAMVARMPAATQRILGNIPRLDGVLQILAAHERRFDSIAHDGMLPLGARMLRVVLDHDRLEDEGVLGREAIAVMQRRTGVYDPAVLDTFARTVNGARTGAGVRALGVAELEPGMVLADDVRTVAGELLVARGHVVSEELVERLGNLKTVHVREPLRVVARA